MLDAVDRLEARRLPARPREQADRQVGARRLVVQRVEPALGQAPGDRDERVGARPPRRDRVVLVEPQHVQQPFVERCLRLLDREIREHERGPRRRRRRDHRPVGRAVVDDLARLLDRREPILAGAHGVEVLEQARRRRPRQRDPRGPLVAQREHAGAVPLGDELERLLARVLDPRALDPRVEPGDVDEPRAVAIGAGGDRAHQRLLTGLAADGDDLVVLNVGAEADDEVGEALERGGIHTRLTLAITRARARARRTPARPAGGPSRERRAERARAGSRREGRAPAGARRGRSRAPPSGW